MDEQQDDLMKAVGLLGMSKIISQLDEQNKSSGYDCPVCGGPLPKRGVEVCMHCRSKLVWCGKGVAKEGEYEAARKMDEQIKAAEKAEEESKKGLGCGCGLWFLFICFCLFYWFCAYMRNEWFPFWVLIEDALPDKNTRADLLWTVGYILLGVFWLLLEFFGIGPICLSIKSIKAVSKVSSIAANAVTGKYDAEEQDGHHSTSTNEAVPLGDIWVMKPDGEIGGPFTKQYLKELKDSGKLPPGLKASRSEDGPWQNLQSG